MFVVVIALELLKLGNPGVGLLTAAVGAGAVIGSLAASMFVSGGRLAALEGFGVALWGVPLALCGLLPYQPTVLVLMCVIGVANALVGIGLYTLPARLVAEDLLARVFGAKESLTALSVALGSLVTPPAIDLLGIRGALGVLGLVPPHSSCSHGRACGRSTIPSPTATRRSTCWSPGIQHRRQRQPPAGAFNGRRCAARLVTSGRAVIVRHRRASARRLAHSTSAFAAHTNAGGS